MAEESVDFSGDLGSWEVISQQLRTGRVIIRPSGLKTTGPSSNFSCDAIISDARMISQPRVGTISVAFPVIRATFLESSVPNHPHGLSCS